MGRDEDFSSFVAARWTPLRRSAVLMGCALSDADDLVQTALTRCYVSWSKVSRADDRDAYAYRVLVNAQRDMHRRRRWREHLAARPPTADPASDLTGEVDEYDAVRHALADLSEVGRAVVVLRFYSGLSERQIADALGIPVGTVKSRLSRALARLAVSRHLSDPADGRTS